MTPPPPPPPSAPLAQPAAGPAKQSFSAAELDHVPRYIAPDDDHPHASPAASEPRAVTADWQPNELASFSGAEWVPPAVAHGDIAAYVAPKAVSTKPLRSPRNVIIAVAGVALVAGLGFGVSKALAPDNVKIISEPTTVETTAKTPTTTSAERPQRSVPPAPSKIGTPTSTSVAPFTAKVGTDADKISVVREVLNILEGPHYASGIHGQRHDNNQWFALDDEYYPIIGQIETESVEIGEPELKDGEETQHVRAITLVSRLQEVWPTDSALAKVLTTKAPEGRFYVDIWYTKDRLTFIRVSSSSTHSTDVAEIYFG